VQSDLKHNVGNIIEISKESSAISSKISAALQPARNRNMSLTFVEKSYLESQPLPTSRTRTMGQFRGPRMDHFIARALPQLFEEQAHWASQKSPSPVATSRLRLGN